MGTETGGKTVLTALQDSVYTITMSRPDHLNAMTPQMISELNAALCEARESKQARVVVLTGAGRAFSAGGDIKEDLVPLGTLTREEWRDYHGKAVELYKLFPAMEKPIIAAVNGVAAGGGCDLVNACDIRIASEDAKFCMAFIKMGITPGVGGTFHLPRQIGPGMAKMLILTGDVIDAREAERIGLVEKTVPRDAFAGAVKDLAKKLANRPCKALAAAKLAINNSWAMSFEQTLSYMTESQYALFSTKDHKEAYTAFLEKREPVFTGE